MSFHDCMRVFAGVIAVVGTIFLVQRIVLGRWQLWQSPITRAEDTKTYWLLVARYACSIVGLAFLATVVPERLFGPILSLVVFAPALAFALLTGRFEWEADDTRIARGRTFWGWVILYGFLCLVVGVMLVVKLLDPRVP